MSKKFVPYLTHILLVLAFGAGIGVTVLYQGFRHFKKNFMRYEFKHEDREIRQRIQSMGIELPEQAWDINLFYQQGGPDVWYYVAFSASPKDIEETISSLLRSGDKEYQNTPPPAEDHEGNPIAWWRDMPPDVKVHKGTLFWIGHDEKNSRVYIFRSTT